MNEIMMYYDVFREQHMMRITTNNTVLNTMLIQLSVVNSYSERNDSYDEV